MGSETRSCNIWGWIIQIILWLSIGFLIFGFVVGDLIKWWGLATFSFFYLIYFISALCHPGLSYLCNKSNALKIHEYMKNLFYSPPQVRWNMECYHYITVSNGKSTHTSKVVTWTGSQNFTFYSWRDVSGLFLLKTHKVFRKSLKVFIKLELANIFELADDVSKWDFQNQKNNFYNSNK